MGLVQVIKGLGENKHRLLLEPRVSGKFRVNQWEQPLGNLEDGDVLRTLVITTTIEEH